MFILSAHRQDTAAAFASPPRTRARTSRGFPRARPPTHAATAAHGDALHAVHSPTPGAGLLSVYLRHPMENAACTTVFSAVRYHYLCFTNARMAGMEPRGGATV